MDDEARRYWDAEAATFDEAADHGLRDPAVRAAWRGLLLAHLPDAPAGVLDLGCGTGSLSVLLAGEGYQVRGLDLAPNMVAAARDKARSLGSAAKFEQADAAEPPYPSSSCDVVLCRHVLWAMPDPAGALSRWIDLLRPGGRLLLVEGYWFTGGGLRAAECERLLHAQGRSAVVRHLDDSAYWGKNVEDERYLVVSLDQDGAASIGRRWRRPGGEPGRADHGIGR